jgi:pimeloyl-ACP methyl ester carboxylesterase
MNCFAHPKDLSSLYTCLTVAEGWSSREVFVATQSARITPQMQTKRKSRWLLKTLLVIALIALLLGAAFYRRPTLIGEEILRARMWTQGIHSHYVQLGAYRIHYLVAGESRSYPVVLVNGLGGTSENWGGMIPEFKSKGLKVYAPDMLGFGRSDKPDVDYSISLQADILKEFLDSQKLDQADLVGWSMGGWIAMKYAAANPQRVHRLILLDSAGLIYDAANVSALRPKNVAQLAHMMDVLNPNPRPIPGFVARDIVRNMIGQDWIIDRTLKSMFTGKDVMDNHLGELTMPVLIIWGKQDLITPMELADRLHRGIPQSALEVIDGCGHLAPVACASQVLPQMEKFLQ